MRYIVRLPETEEEEAYNENVKLFRESLDAILNDDDRNIEFHLFDDLRKRAREFGQTESQREQPQPRRRT